MKVFQRLISFVFLLSSFQSFGQDKSSADGRLHINEIYFYNSATDKINYKIRDKKRDWIEIYNGTNKSVKTRQLYFTDDLKDPLKFRIGIRRRRHNKVKKHGFIAVYLNNTGKRRQPKSSYYSDSTTIYLVRNIGSAIPIMDTIKLPDNKRYPYSRYPDGKKFRTTDALSPGFGNTFLNESESWRQAGISIQVGPSSTMAPDFKNSSRYTAAWALGIYRSQNYRKFRLEEGIKFASRGYGISYHNSTNTTKGVRELSTTGKQRMNYLDFSSYLSHKINNKFGAFAGGVFSIRLSSYIHYDQKLTFTYASTGQQVQQNTKFSSHDYNSALDIFDLSFVIGLRYYCTEAVNFSIFCVRDFAGFNSNSFTGSGNQKTFGVYFLTEIPLRRSLIRVKSKKFIR